MNFKKERLDFSHQNLSDFPKEIFTVRKLRKLDLSHNNIKAIPPEIETLKYLETIDLSHNEISNPYAKIFRIDSLRILILSHNKINNLPKQIGNLTDLKILNLAHNKLTQLPESLKTLSSLEELNISSNLFLDFPEEIFCLKNLKTIWLSRNYFRTFPIKKLLKDSINLKSVYCYGPAIDDQFKIHNDYKFFSKLPGNSLDTIKHNLASNSTDGFSFDVVRTNNKSTVNKNKIFISYSHQDTEWLSRIKVHLSSLAHEGIDIEVWDDTRIKSGMQWKFEIEQALSQAYIGILIISADFLASDFIMKNELPPLLMGAAEKGTKIIPIVASPCRFIQNKNLSRFQAVNDPKTEVLSGCSKSEQENILVRMVNDIELHIQGKI
jgi:hypothetical protein